MLYNDLFIQEYYIPDKLDDVEVVRLLEKVKTGDREAYELLAKHNIRLVIRIVLKNFHNISYDKSDLVAIGNVGLTKAIKNFDLGKNIKFSTYATKCIMNEILMFLRKNKNKSMCDSLDSYIKINDEDSDISFNSFLSSNSNIEDDYEEIEYYKFINELVNSLPKREKIIIKMYFGFYNDKKYNQRMIAERLKLSQSYVSRIIPKIIKKLKNQIDLYYIFENELNAKQVISLKKCK